MLPDPNHLRPYRVVPTRDLFLRLFCNRLVAFKPFLRHSSQLFRIGAVVLGFERAANLFNQTFGRAFTAGSTLVEAEDTAAVFRKEGISIMFNYCAEGAVSLKPKSRLDYFRRATPPQQLEATFDFNAQMYAQTMAFLSQNPWQKASIKISSLINADLLLKLNHAVKLRNEFWTKYSDSKGQMSAELMFRGLSEMQSGISQSQFEQYVRQVYSYQGNHRTFTLNEFQFKSKHHPLYISNSQGQRIRSLLNHNYVIRLFCPWSSSEAHLANNFVERLMKIFDATKRDTQFRILVDAQQSYLQLAIESITEQLQCHYNRQNLLVMSTIQNYLERAVSRAKWQVELAKMNNIFLGAKMVRGAYLNEERGLQAQNNQNKKSKQIQSSQSKTTIVPDYDHTTNNFTKSIETFLLSGVPGQLMVSSHHSPTVISAINMAKSQQMSQNSLPNRKMHLSFAQLLGIADHLTYSLIGIDDHRVYKCLPWAPANIMVAYFLRRAEEVGSNQYGLKLQRNLIIVEIKRRYIE